MTILTTSTLAISGKLVFITKYTIEILPVIILLFSLGVKNRLDKTLFIIFVAIILLSTITPYYPAKKIRTEGHNLVGNTLNRIETDKIIFTYYEPTRFLRYLDKDVEMISINKNNRFEYLDTPKNILEKVNKKQKVTIVFLDSVSFIPPHLIKISQERKVPEMFITFSIIRNELTKELETNYSDHIITKIGDWTIVTSTKLR